MGNKKVRVLIDAVFILVITVGLVHHKPGLVVWALVVLALAQVLAMICKDLCLLWLPAGTLEQWSCLTIPTVSNRLSLRFERQENLPLRLERALPRFLLVPVKNRFPASVHLDADTPRGISSIYRLERVGLAEWVSRWLEPQPEDPDGLHEWIGRTEGILASKLLKEGYRGVRVHLTLPSAILAMNAVTEGEAPDGAGT